MAIRTGTLSQTVNFQPGFFHTFTGAITYGGDAFACGTCTGTGISGYQRQCAYRATYALDFYDGTGAHLGTDTSPNVFSLVLACVGSSGPKKTCGYRRTVGFGDIPGMTRSIRFTATLEDRVTACYNYSTTGAFKNGFDNLWLEAAYLGPPTAGFRAGPAPVPSAKVAPPAPTAPPR